MAVPAIAAFASGGASLVPAFAGSLASLLPTGQQQSTAAGVADADETPKKEGDPIDWETLIKEDESPSGPLDVRTFRDRFGKMLGDCEIESLVVMIDDLDRCYLSRSH